MKFKLKCLRNGKIEYWNYDNIKNIVTDPNGYDPLAKLKVSGYRKRYPAWGEDTNFKIDDRLCTLYISLGLKCNFSCKYCQQSDLPKNHILQANPRKVEKFLEILRKSKLVVDKQIIFWGGDPLVYWKTIELLIPHLRKMYPEIEIGMVTNGSLLDDKKFETIKKYNMTVVISYDGHNTLRDYPVFDDPVVFESVKKALHEGVHISVLPLVNNVSDMPWDIEKDLEERFGMHIGVGKHSIVKCNNDSPCYSEYAYISDERLQEYEEKLYEEFHKPRKEMGFSALDRLDELRNGIARGMPVDSTRSSCSSQFGNHLTIDMEGNVLLCMNYPFKQYGSILDKEKIVITDYYSDLRKKMCIECPYHVACFGVCPIVKDENGASMKTNCRNYKPYARAILKSAIDSLYGIRVLEFIPVEESNKKNDSEICNPIQQQRTIPIHPQG